MPGIYCGIDPGKDGFAAWIDADSGEYIDSIQQPLIGRGKTSGDNFDKGAMIRLVREWKAQDVKLIVLEELSPMGGSRGTPQTHFWQGGGYLLWQGIILSHDLPLKLVDKNRLKRIMDIKSPARIPKEKPLPKSATKAEKKAWNTRDKQRLARYQARVKAEAIKVCSFYFPNVDLRRTPKCKNIDDNKCESILYAVCASKLDHRG